MANYKLNPFAAFVESRLVPAAIQHAIFHRLTGQMAEFGSDIPAWVQAVRIGHPLPLSPEYLSQLGDSAHQIRYLIDLELLIPDGHDPLASFVDYYVGRPLQNPALTYHNQAGEVSVVRISMAERVFSPEAGKLPPVIEESFPELATNILLAADSTKTLRQIHGALRGEQISLLDDLDFRGAIDFLSRPERQLIKFAPAVEGFAQPFYPANIIPRNLYHSRGSTTGARGGDAKSLADFHRRGIDNATWEFDVIEPTINHAFRFPNDALGGLSYGARFFKSILSQGVLEVTAGRRLQVLEVGGGTGAFARAFIEQVRAEGFSVRYHILDLAPTLIESQRRLLAGIEPAVTHYYQDATRFSIQAAEFDLIIANEVIADFPVAQATRKQATRKEDDDAASPAVPAQENFEWSGDGAQYVAKYDLSTDAAPDTFFINAGVFEFLERAWHHLAPGGVVVVTEYGALNDYPREAHHLNHAEYSIHFGHVIQCAEKLGFVCRLQALSDFLEVNDEVRMLTGSNEHIQCLNHVLQKYGRSLEYRLIAEREFKESFQEIVDRIDLSGFSFQPLRNNFHFGPNLDDFMALMMKKPLP